MARVGACKNGKEWLKRELRAYRGVILFLTVLSAVMMIASLSFAFMTRYLINNASNGNKKGLIVFSCVLVGVLLLRILLQTVLRYYSEKTRAKIVRDLRGKLYKDILRTDYAHIQGYHSGELLQRLTGDLQEIATTTVGLLPSLVGMLTQCVGAIVALLTTDPLFTLIYVVCGGLFGGMAALFRKKIKKTQKEVLEADGKSRSYMQEGVSSMMTVKAYGAEETSAQKNVDFAEIYYKKRVKRGALAASMQAIFSLVSNFGLIFAVVWCSVSVLRGNTDYGTILSVILLLMQFQHPLSGFSTIMPAYYARLASGERLAEMDDLPKEPQSVQSYDLAVYDRMHSIALENVSFQYDRDPVLTGANLRVHQGEIVCITGASGTGKSTLFRLLLHIYTPTSGGIFFHFEEEKKGLTVEDRALFAYVPQGNFLFSGSIYENITFFANEKTLTKEKIAEALENSAAEFVYDLPQGLETVLLEKGEGLSEGQLQRLAIARALLSERPILLLDEATSALDGETEAKVLQNIRRLQNKTCLIVTHRIQATKIADKVFELKEGAIAEI